MRHRRSWFVPPALLLAAAIAAVGLAPGLAVAQEEDSSADRGAAAARPVPGPGGLAAPVRQPPGAVRPANLGAGTIPINLEWYLPSRRPPARSRLSRAALGYASTGSRDYYLELVGGLQRTRNLLLVDNRGTGASGLINCRPRSAGTTPGDEEYDCRVAACGEQLTDRRHPGGGFVHGSDLYGTANAARDLADAYGPLEIRSTCTATSRQLLRADLRRPLPAAAAVADPGRHLAGARHRPLLPLHHRVGPGRLRPDSPAQRGLRAGRPRVVDGPDRRPGRAAAPGPGRRHDPRAGQRPVHLTVDVGILIALVNNAGSDAGVYRELDAAARVPQMPTAPPAAAGRQVALHRRRRAGAGVVGRPVQRRQLHRLPAGVRHAGAAGGPEWAQHQAAVDGLPDDVYAPFSPSRSGRPPGGRARRLRQLAVAGPLRPRPSPAGRRCIRRPCRCWCCQVGSTP